METLVYGVASITMGPVAADGDMGTVLADVGEILEDTCELKQSDTTVTEKFSEQSDDPLIRIKKKGVKTLKFSIVNFDPTNLAKHLGGVSGQDVGGDDIWDEPDVVADIERSALVTTTNGIKFRIVRGDVNAVINWPLKKNDIGRIDVTIVSMKPKKAGVRGFRVIKPA